MQALADRSALVTGQCGRCVDSGLVLPLAGAILSRGHSGPLTSVPRSGQSWALLPDTPTRVMRRSGRVVEVSRWYLRSTKDRDTHLADELNADGTVTAHCGVVFRPLQALRDRGPGLPGNPPDPEQVCLECCRIMPG